MRDGLLSERMERVTTTICSFTNNNKPGKSTLLKALTGSGGENVAIREGWIAVAKKARMGYLGFQTIDIIITII